MNNRTFLTTALVCLAVLVVASPAGAKGGPPAGKGGPPPWAGGGTSAKVHGARGAAKQAEHAVRKAGKAARKVEQARGRGAEPNPAMTCFGLLAELGEDFYSRYGTNPNEANAFGMCVSEQAQARGEDGDGEADDPAQCETASEEEPAEEPLVASTTVDEGENPVEGEEPPDDGDCGPAGEEPGECEDPADEPSVEDGSAEPTGEEPATGDDCSTDEEEPGEPDDGEPEDADGATAFALTCFLPRAHANPFALCF